MAAARPDNERGASGHARQVNRFGTVDQPEWLFAWHTEEPAAKNPGPGNDSIRQTRKMTGIRGLSTAESESSKAGDDLMRRCLFRSGYAGLRHAGRHWWASVEKLSDPQIKPMSQETWDAGADVQRDFKGFLSAFRAFDDRTSSWLSSQFGRSDAALREFKRLLSFEFDHNFAYRLCCALRNLVEHQDDVLSVSIRGNLEPDTGVVVRTSSVALDPRELVAMGRGMRSATREELRHVTGLLDARRVVSSVDESCELVHAGLLRALWPRVQEAIDLAEGFHAEAQDIGGPSAWAFFLPTSFDFGELRKKPTALPMRHSALAEARTLTQKVAVEIASVRTGAAYQDGCWQDLLLQEDGPELG